MDNHCRGSAAGRANQFGSPESCQALQLKIFCFTVFLICGRRCPARAAMRGASRSSRNVARVAMDACGVRLAYVGPAKTPQRTAKSCGSGAATVASIPAGLCWQGNGDNKRRSPGRARISRKAIARGRPGCPGCTREAVCVFSTHCTRCLRAQSAPGLPCALCQREGQRRCKARAKARRGNVDAHPHRCLTS